MYKGTHQSARNGRSRGAPHSGGRSFSRGGGGGFRRPFKGGRPGGFKGRYGGRGKPKGGVFFDMSRFINKAVITEEVEHFVPEHTFASFQFDPRVLAGITKKGYTQPTPIQDRSIGHIMAGRDVVGIANTGTGKTAAFLLPLIHKTLTGRGERVLIMVPTRELAQQIAQELLGFSFGLRIFYAVCVGGAGIGAQMASLRRMPQFVIGTPGRLKDLIERKALILGDFKTVVLDEADRMLDMGFIHDMRHILSLLPKPRHTLFFSATLSSDIERLISEFLSEPVRISVKTRETAASIDQDVVKVPSGANKIDVLHNLLVQPDFSKVLIFGRTKHGVEKLMHALIERGVKAESIHGNKTQGKRQRALDLFKRDHVQVLVATDVAARGLDIAGVTHVINYELPATHEDYIHRIGRTGRAGKRGKALTFIDVR